MLLGQREKDEMELEYSKAKDRKLRDLSKSIKVIETHDLLYLF